MWVGSESAEQVVFANGAVELPMTLRGLRGLDVELSGPTFFPKQCRLELALPACGSATGSRGTSTRSRLKGVVRKVQTTSAAPSHTVWVHLEEDDPALLGALRAVLDARRDRTGVDNAMSAGALLGAAPEVAAGGAVARALELGVPYVDARSYEIQPSNAALIPEELALKHRLFPLFFVGGAITLGMDDPGDLAVIDQVRLRTGCPVEPCLCSAPSLDALLVRTYRARAAKDDPAEGAAGPEDSETTSKEPVSTRDSIVHLVRALVEDAARDGASDIHIEPERDFSRVRLRIDGILHERSTHPIDQHAPIVSRIKVMAKIDIAETRRPQDGQFSTTLNQSRLEVRVSTIPTVHGENVVMRVLRSDGKAVGLHELGMPEWALGKMEEFLSHPNGMILVTGPTGSGKTTTLYAALARLSTIERNIVTIEDPVERRVPLLRQMQVNVKAGITFAAGLRSILRQDPDVIMVGEIRDHETAEIAVQSALTGHLVLSTLHTNSAAGAVVRLSEVGIPPFLITSSLRAVISQRLVRRICQACRAPVSPDPGLLAELGFGLGEPLALMAGRGCARCLHTGYKGRIGIYEMLQITPGLGRALLGGASREEIEREGNRALVCGLRDDALQRARDGLTTIEEIARVVGPQSPASFGRGA